MISCIINPFVVYTNDEAGNASQMYAYVNIVAIECLTIQILIMKSINYSVWIMYLKRNRVSSNDYLQDCSNKRKTRQWRNRNILNNDKSC